MVVTYSRETLNVVGSSGLGNYFVHLFDKIGNLELRAQFEMVVKILRSRCFAERLDVYLSMRDEMDERVDLEDYEGATVLKDMLEDYCSRVLD